MPFGYRLKEARNRKGLTQEELAEKIGVTKGSIGNYESETSSPKEPILIKLMKELEVDANYLYQDLIESNENALSDDEIALLSAWRGAEDLAKKIALEALQNNQKKGSEQSAI